MDLVFRDSAHLDARPFQMYWNDLFWAVHPDGRAMLDSVEEALELRPGELTASRRVLAEYGKWEHVWAVAHLCARRAPALQD